MFSSWGCQQLKDAMTISSRGFIHSVHKICASKASIEKTSYRLLMCKELQINPQVSMTS